MEDKIEVGEYVRTKNGIIYKIENGEEFYADIIDVGIGIIPDVDGIWIDEEHLDYIDKRDIVKHCKIISEVVEIGDYVNGKLIHKIDKGPNYCYLYYGNCKTFVDYQIKTILTKEQFEANCYKVGGEDE